MTISVIDGNLLDATENMICHQVNAKGEMNTGIAAQIKQRWPEVFNEYRDYVLNSSSPMGSMLEVQIQENPDKYIVNLFGQDDFGYDNAVYTQMASLRSALESVRKFAEVKNLSVALPYNLGCVRGGANWDEVYNVIREVFEGHNVTLYRLDLN